METGKIKYVQKDRRTKNKILGFYGCKKMLKVYSVLYLGGTSGCFSINAVKRGVGIKIKYG